MKTRLTILVVTIVALLYSCKDREEDDFIKEAIKKANNPKQKLSQKEQIPIVKTGNIVAKTLNNSEPDVPTDPIEGGDPRTITPPKR